VCSGAVGEPCNPFAGAPCRSYGAAPAQGRCGFGDREGATFRCHPPGCALESCRYWDGECREMQPFTMPAIGSPLLACYDAGDGMKPHEHTCVDGVDNDEDGASDGADADCLANSGDFWLSATGRGPRAMCLGGACGAVDARGGAQCASGIGGCFDDGCHSEVCWPRAGSCALTTAAEAVCKWWDSVADVDNSCDAAELIDRADGSWCGFGCSCEAGVAAEYTCGDRVDNDRDGRADALDPDCQRQHGDPCMVGRFNGQRSFSGVVMGGFNGGADQCQGARAVCWCANAECSAGVCLGEQADCVATNSFHCSFYAAPTATDCGPAGARADDSEFLPTWPMLGVCWRGAPLSIVKGQPGEACEAWHQCDSGLCMCGSADCQSRVCWAAGDCGNSPCVYRANASECWPLADGTPPPDCDGGSAGELHPSDNCTCGPNGIPRETACDDGITNDWRDVPGGDTLPDWYDPDCHSAAGNAPSPYEVSLRARYGAR
jgi:hypothetical protein